MAVEHGLHSGVCMYVYISMYVCSMSVSMYYMYVCIYDLEKPRSNGPHGVEASAEKIFDGRNCLTQLF